MRKYFFLVISAGTLVMLIVMAKSGATLRTMATPKGILDLEFAYNGDKAAAVMKAWQNNDKTDIVTAAKINTQLDFIFLLFYSAFLYNGCRIILVYFKGADANIGLLLANGAIAAGLLDILENIGMLFTLHGYTNSAIPLATCSFSIVKWLLALAALLYLLVGGGWILLNKIRK